MGLPRSSQFIALGSKAIRGFWGVIALGSKAIGVKMEILELIFFSPRQQGNNYPLVIALLAKDTYIFPLWY
jgi:hypothetical protein